MMSPSNVTENALPPFAPHRKIKDARSAKDGARCAGETGEMKRMKESYGEGVANHTGPESCVAGREAGYRSVGRGKCGPGH
jgi:hypothetical protein